MLYSPVQLILLAAIVTAIFFFLGFVPVLVPILLGVAWFILAFLVPATSIRRGGPGI